MLSAGSRTLDVTFTPTDTTNFASVTDSVTITVNQATPVLSWTTPAAIAYGTALGAAQLNASAPVPGKYSYSPSAGAVLTLGSQPLSVIFKPTDSTDYTSATDGVTLTVIQAVPSISWIPKGPIAIGMPLGPEQLNATAIAPAGTTPVGGDFNYTPSAGTIFSTAGPQKLSVSFTPFDTTDYTSASAGITMNPSVFDVVAWGDSLTWGYQGFYDQGDYPDDLKKLLSLSVKNMGVDGQTSTQIGVRQGGVKSVVSVAGGMIPTSGGVTVTFPTCSQSDCPTYTPVTTYGPAGGLSGTILGVHGTITIDSMTSILTFTPTTPPTSPVSAPGTPPFIVDTPYSSALPIFWEGRNDFMWTAQILSDLAGQVATVPTGQDYAVLSIINMQRPSEWYGVSGNTLYQWLIPFNEQLESIYQSHYIDIRKILVDAYDPTQATDVTDYQHDEVPTSLRAIDIEGTLVNAIGPNDTTITLTSKSGNFPISGSILNLDTGANAELVQVTAASGDTFSVTRGYGGNQTSHAAGVPMKMNDIIHLNAQGSQVVACAVAHYLSAYANSTLSTTCP